MWARLFDLLITIWTRACSKSVMIVLGPFRTHVQRLEATGRVAHFTVFFWLAQHTCGLCGQDKELNVACEVLEQALCG